MIGLVAEDNRRNKPRGYIGDTFHHLEIAPPRGIGSNPVDCLAHHYTGHVVFLVITMQSFFTFTIEFVFISSVVFFATAFFVGFIHRDLSSHTVINDAVIPFSHSYRKPKAAEMDWQQWSVSDLRKASQRHMFNIPLRIDSKVLTKKQLVDFYTVAMANGFDSATVWAA